MSLRLLALVVLLSTVIPSVSATAQTSPSGSTLRPKETVVLFATAGHLDVPSATWHLPVHGWVYEPENSTARKALIASLLKRNYGLAVTPEAAPHFDARVNLLLSDNKRGRRIVVELAGRRFALPASRPNGHFSGMLELPATVVDAAAKDGMLPVRAVLAAGDSRSLGGVIQLVGPEGLSVISDIDDTVKVTHVTDRKRLLEQTLLKPFEPVPGMADILRRLHRTGAPVHFVSSSPWHLYGPLTGFLAEAGFPPATLSLKVVRLKDTSIFDLFKPGLETKPPQIEAIMARYPKRRFVLIGDSGEQDPEVYAAMARRYPDRIDRILIRNVTAARAGDARFTAVFAGIDPGRWQLFDNPEEIRLPP
jgi:hypothetical protein